MEGGSRLGLPGNGLGFGNGFFVGHCLRSFSVIFFVDCFGMTVVDGVNGLEEDDK